MALETLRGVKEIGGLDVIQGKTNDLIVMVNGEFIIIDHETNAITFKIQDGPIKENGVNGCQVDTLIEVAKLIVEGLNKKFSCRHNRYIISDLESALIRLDMRKKDRESRGVEGENEV